MPETVLDAEKHTQCLIILADLLTQSPALQDVGMGLRGKMEGQRTRSPRGSRKRGLMAKGRMQERGTWGAPKNFGRTFIILPKRHTDWSCQIQSPIVRKVIGVRVH